MTYSCEIPRGRINYEALTGDYINGKYGQFKNWEASAGSKVNTNGAVVDSEGRTCTDGEDDGKLNIFDAVISMGTGVVKGLVNGIKGCFFDSEGNFSLGKTLLTAGVVALSIAFPVVGAVACGIGLAMGGLQLGKGIIGACTADNDAEAKAAFENIGDGAFTVVSCATGVKASMSAMKSTANLSAIDDIAKAAGKSADDVLGSVDDLAKAMDSTTDATKAASKYLKSKGVSNADEILRSLDDTTDATKIMEAVKKQGKMSSLDALKVKDGVKFRDKAKAFYNDAKSSTANNGKKILDNVTDYRAKKDAYKKANEQCKEANDAWKSKEIGKKSTDGLRSPEGQARIEAAKNMRNAKAELDGTTIQKLISEPKTKFGNLTRRLRSTSPKDLISSLKTNKVTLKDITSKMSNFELTRIKNSLSTKGNAVLEFLTTKNGTYAQAVQQFGYNTVGEVLQVMYGYGQTAENMSA